MVYHDPFRCGPNPCGWPCAEKEEVIVCEYYHPVDFSTDLAEWDILEENGDWLVSNGELYIPSGGNLKLRLKRTMPAGLGRNLYWQLTCYDSVGFNLGLTYIKCWTSADATLTNGHWARIDYFPGEVTAGDSQTRYSAATTNAPTGGIQWCVCDGWSADPPPYNQPYGTIYGATTGPAIYQPVDPAAGIYMGLELGSPGTNNVWFRDPILFPVLWSPNDDPPIGPAWCSGCEQL